ncbi:hydroxymethylglutaryl-CoA reductase, degradative [Desulfobulbus sp. AH-315-M07]|nr:hydroxymethylglutaryl-CoA reductase, degradative [Desulfobulbus sp. AH-315-M07]
MSTTINSEIPGFYRLGMDDRRARVAAITGVSEEDLDVLSSGNGLQDEQANRMVENVLGVLGLPLGLCVNLRVNGRDCLVPMAIEEPSVVAAASHASKLLRAGGGVTAEVTPPHMVGQIQLLDVPEPESAERAILDARDELLQMANDDHPRLVGVGGGAVDLEVHHLAPLEDDPCGPMVVVHLIVDVRDAMGANAINSMCEALAPRIAELSRGRVGLRILSNLADRRTVTVRGRVPFTVLEGKGKSTGRKLAEAIVEASVFAERDPYRAATHNKGVMNGIDSVLLAFGQDWRAVEAGAHAFAARNGRYTALARWRIDGEALVGELTLPMAVGTVGGVAGVHPVVQLTRRVAHVSAAAELSGLVAAVGLAQNLSALRALAAEGIQRGHMSLHARNVAVEAGAESDDEIEAVASQIASQGTVNIDAAKEAMRERAAQRKAASRIPDQYGEGPLMQRFATLREQYLPQIMTLIETVVDEGNPDGSSLTSMCGYHMETGGKRLRAMLPLLVGEALGHSPDKLVPLGAACEMLHNATLVHDDLQDGDLVRRGRMTVWNRFGIPQAINLGDAMFYYTLLLAQRLQVRPKVRENVARRVLLETLRVIDGQEREFALKGPASPGGSSQPVTLERYFEMVEGKTSGLFSLPIAGAAEACGAPAALIEGLGEAARHMGVLFQIQDDTLDLYGEKGRGVRGSDIGEGKRSVLVVHALQNASEADAKWLLAVLDRDRSETTEEDVTRVLALLEQTGSLQFALSELVRRKELALEVEALSDQPALRGLVGGMCELFMLSIAPLMQQHRGKQG